MGRNKMTIDPQATLDHFRGRLDTVISAVMALVDLESPSGDVERSRAVTKAVEEMFLDAVPSIGIERVEAAGYGTHLVLSIGDTATGSLMILGHTDTVHPVGTRSKNPTRIENGLVYGCGIFDMKANIVLLAEALKYLSASGELGAAGIKILLSCDEEVGSPTGRELVERIAGGAASCLVLEPSADGKAKTGRKGTGMFSLSAHGIPAHSGLEPEKGSSAVVELARQIDRVQAISDLALGTTVNVTTFHGGSASNVIAEYATCEIDVRFENSSEAARVTKELSELTPFDARNRLELSGEINRPPLERTDAVVGLYDRARTLAAELGHDLGETKVGGASDGNFVAALGVPVLDGLGVRGSGAHTLDEHIFADDIPYRAALFAMLIADAAERA